MHFGKAFVGGFVVAQTSNSFSNSDVRHINVNYKNYMKVNKTVHSVDDTQAIRNRRIVALENSCNPSPFDSFWVDKGHENGPEIHVINDNGLIDCYNEASKKYITTLISRPDQVLRYYSRTGLPVTEDVENIVSLCEKYLEVGWNKDKSPMMEYFDSMRLNDLKDNSFLNQFCVKLKQAVAKNEGVSSDVSWSALSKNYDGLPFYKLLHYSNWVDSQHMSKKQKQQFVNNFIRETGVLPKNGKYPNVMEMYDKISDIVDNISELNDAEQYNYSLESIQNDLRVANLEDEIDMSDFSSR